MAVVQRLALILVVFGAAVVNAQNTTSGCTGYSYAYSCFNNGCRWCSDSSETDSGLCVASTTLCSANLLYTTTITNPCGVLTTQTACIANPVCGWCTTGSNQCWFAGFNAQYSNPNPWSCAGTFIVSPCSAQTTKVSCYNTPYSCEWNPATTTCSYSGVQSTDCVGTTSTVCTSFSASTYYNNDGSCGWCSSVYGTGTGKCLFYTSGVPSACPSSSSFTYNSNWGGGAALAVAVGLAGAVLIAVIVAPLVVCACVIGCTVYFCCIRPRQQTTVVVAGGYQQMPTQGVPMQPGQPSKF